MLFVQEVLTRFIWYVTVYIGSRLLRHTVDIINEITKNHKNILEYLFFLPYALAELMVLEIGKQAFTLYCVSEKSCPSNWTRLCISNIYSLNEFDYI